MSRRSYRPPSREEQRQFQKYKNTVTGIRQLTTKAFRAGKLRSLPWRLEAVRNARGISKNWSRNQLWMMISNQSGYGSTFHPIHSRICYWARPVYNNEIELLFHSKIGSKQQIGLVLQRNVASIRGKGELEREKEQRTACAESIETSSTWHSPTSLDSRPFFVYTNISLASPFELIRIQQCWCERVLSLAFLSLAVYVVSLFFDLLNA